MQITEQVQYRYCKKIFSVIFMLLFPSLCGFYAMLGIVCNPRNWRRYLPFFVVAAFSLAYSYVPDTMGCDLLRYFASVRECSELTTFAEIVNYKHDGCFVRNIVFWLIGKAGDVHLLPGLSTATVYGIITYISCSCAEEFKQERLLPFILLLQIILLPYWSVIDNVRNVCAFSILILAVYLDIIKGKRNPAVIMLYILPCFIHTSGALLVAFRIFASIAKTTKAKTAVILSAVLFPYAINFAYAHIGWFSFGGSIGDVLQAGIWRAWRYYNTPGGLDDYERSLLASNYEPVQRFFMISFAVLILVLILYYSRHMEQQWRGFNSFAFLICTMTVACNVFITPHYWRFYCAVVMSCPAILYPLICARSKVHYIIRIIMYGLAVYGIGGIAMNVWNLRYTVDWSEWIERFLLTNPYTIIEGILKVLLR